MRKLILGMVVALTLFTMDLVFAAQTADITVTVTVRKLSVSVSSGTFAFGLVNEGTTTVAGSSIVVTNDGNVTELFQLKLVNPTGWTADQLGTPAADHYKLGAIFRDTTAPVAGDFTDSQDYISTSYVSPTATIFAKNGDADSMKGFNVAASTTRELWFAFVAPSSTSISTQQSITTTLNAQ